MMQLITISILLVISVKSQAEGCCEFSKCNFEKLEISRQLLTMASQIQNQVITSGKLNDCSTSSSNTTSISTTSTFEPPTSTTIATTMTTEPSTSTITTISTTSEPSTSTTVAITRTTIPAGATNKQRFYIPENVGNFTYAKRVCDFTTESWRSVFKLLTIDTPFEWDSEVKVNLRKYRNTSSYHETQFFWIDGGLVGGVWLWGDMTPVDLTFLPLKLWSGLTQADNQTSLMLVYERLVDEFYLSPVDPAVTQYQYSPNRFPTTIRLFCESNYDLPSLA